MQHAFSQREWHDIPLRDVAPGAAGVADRRLYHAFYARLLSDPAAIAPEWIRQKSMVAQWLEREFLAGRDALRTRICSVGAGVGVMEAYLASRGFRIEIVECEPLSVAHAQRAHPGVHGAVADARRLPFRAAAFGFLYVSAVDYVFDRDGYRAVLAEIARVLEPAATAVVICVSNLSVRGMLQTIRGAARAALRRDDSGAVRWGYQRTVGEHLDLGRNAGLACTGVYQLDHDARVIAKREASWRLGWPTLRDNVVALSFRHA